MWIQLASPRQSYQKSSSKKKNKNKHLNQSESSNQVNKHKQ